MSSDGPTSRIKDSSFSSIRHRLIQKSLEQVPLHGWTRHAIVEAADQLQHDLPASTCSISIAGLIGDPEELIFEQMRIWKQDLERDLESMDVGELSVGQRAKAAIQARLSYMQEHLEKGTWSAAMAIGMHPLYATTTTAHLNDLSTVVCNFCFQGTNSDSITVPAQQATLGAIYVATELHLLTDDYPYTDTWEFLQQRIVEWETFWGFPSSSAFSPSHPLESSTNPTLPTSPLSPADVMSVAWTVSTALASGVQSVVFPHTVSTGASDTSFLQQLKPPKQLPVLPILGAPPAPFSNLWTAIFDDKSSLTSPATWGTAPSHYAPVSPVK
jgi:rpsU-divergently transcribed protein